MILELQNVQVLRGERALFAPISLKLDAGETVTVMGPSGCGKSTLLAAVCGNLASCFTLRGNILLDGRSVLPVPMEKRKIGILFQDDLLFPHMNVAENLAFALPQKLPKHVKREKVVDALKKAGLSGFEKRDPATLSGGQRARVSLMRSLLAEPKAILLDEPFSKLDRQLRERIRRFVFDVLRKGNIPALLVTHDPMDCPEGRVIDLEVERR